MLLRSSLALVQLVVLARLLSKDDLGVLAVTTALQSLMLIVTDFGLSSALIHHRNMTERQRSTLFWINLGMGASASLLMIVCGVWVAGFYGEPELAAILMWTSLALPLGALGQQHRAMAEKSLNFRALAKIEIAATTAGTVVAVSGAVSGLGVYGAVLGLLVTTASTSALIWMTLARGWRPQAVLAMAESRHLLRYGLEVVGLNVLNALGQQADIFVGGRLFSAAALGSYHPPREFGMRIMMVINPIVTRISFPVIAEAQHDRGRVASLYAQTLLVTASINFPLYAALGLFASQIVEIVLGPDWLSSAQLLQAVALWCALRSIGNPVGSLLLGVGSTSLALKSSTAVTLLVVIFAIAGGMLGGPVGVPLSLAVLYAVLIVGFWRLLVWPSCGIGFYRYHEQLVRPAICTFVAAIAAGAVSSLIEEPILVLVVASTTGAFAYLLASAYVNSAWLRLMLDLLLTRRRGNVA